MSDSIHPILDELNERFKHEVVTRTRNGDLDLYVQGRTRALSIGPIVVALSIGPIEVVRETKAFLVIVKPIKDFHPHVTAVENSRFVLDTVPGDYIDNDNRKVPQAEGVALKFVIEKPDFPKIPEFIATCVRILKANAD